MKKFNKKTIAKLIDHTDIRREAKAKDIKQLCQEAKEYGFRSVCVRPRWVRFAKNQLKGTKMKLIKSAGIILIMFAQLLTLAGCQQKADSTSLAPLVKPQGTVIPFDSDRWAFVGSATVEDYLGEQAAHLGIIEEGKFINFGISTSHRLPIIKYFFKFILLIASIKSFSNKISQLI